MCRSRKPVNPQGFRGFESLPLRFVFPVFCLVLRRIQPQQKLFRKRPVYTRKRHITPVLGVVTPARRSPDTTKKARPPFDERAFAGISINIPAFASIRPPAHNRKQHTGHSIHATTGTRMEVNIDFRGGMEVITGSGMTSRSYRRSRATVFFSARLKQKKLSPCRRRK